MAYRSARILSCRLVYLCSIYPLFTIVAIASIEFVTEFNENLSESYDLPLPQYAVMDLNTNALEFAARQLVRYQPE
jgi:hypothetical protein